MKTTNYNIRLDPVVKMKAEDTFSVFGLNLSEAINVFLHKAIIERGFPFDVRNPIPNVSLLQAMDEAERIIAEYNQGTRKPKPLANARELFAAMDAEDEAERDNE
ncbi:MAG: type II toxin-antitoxin system RelB/DinJ family antitoxin [Oscillospiraceae bacterium]|jgi:DNA-damage-inducible protein J|nr:type II toxin-antitoxin system RelB/DinJ family antitoxin [Oscillospiraceae bacterium]